MFSPIALPVACIKGASGPTSGASLCHGSWYHRRFILAVLRCGGYRGTLLDLDGGLLRGRLVHVPSRRALVKPSLSAGSRGERGGQRRIAALAAETEAGEGRGWRRGEGVERGEVHAAFNKNYVRLRFRRFQASRESTEGFFSFSKYTG